VGTCGKARGKWILVFRVIVCIISLVFIFYYFINLYCNFWLGNGGDINVYMFLLVLVSKSK
jgi:hypothetical protein